MKNNISKYKIGDKVIVFKSFKSTDYILWDDDMITFLNKVCVIVDFQDDRNFYHLKYKNMYFWFKEDCLKDVRLEKLNKILENET